jgi:hypothetical protein
VSLFNSNSSSLFSPQKVQLSQAIALFLMSLPFFVHFVILIGFFSSKRAAPAFAPLVI